MTESKAVAPPKRQDFVPLNKVANLAELFQHPDFKNRIASAAPKHFNAERLLRTMVTATQKTPKLLAVNPMSMLGACITIAALGLEPNTPLQHAHLIPFDVNKWNKETRKREFVRTDVQVIIGYPGYLDLIYRNDKVVDVHCDIFYEDEIASGAFSYSHGSKKHLHHKPSTKTREPGEQIAGAYMYAKLANGGEVFEVLNLAQIHRARARSQGFKSAMYAHDDAVKSNKDPMKDSRYADAPWIKDFETMAKKTVLRAGQKWVPKSVELAAAMTIDGEAEDVTIDFGSISSPEQVLDGTFETVDTGEPAAITEDKTPKVTVPPAKITPEAEAAYTTAGKATKAKAKASPPAADDPPPGRFEDNPDDNYSNQSVAAEDARLAAATTYPMFNAFGEEDDGPMGPTSDAIEFAMALTRAFNEASDDGKITLLEFNTDSMLAAQHADKRAAEIISVLGAEPEKAEKKPKMTMEPKPNPPFNDTAAEEIYDVPRKKTAKGGWDVVAWVNEAKVKIAECETGAALDAFAAVNFASIKALPTTAATIFRNAFDKRHEDLAPEDDEVPMPDDEPEPDHITAAGSPPPGEQSSPINAANPPKDQWEMAFRSFQIDINMAKTLEDLNAFSRNAAVKSRLRQLKEARPDLAAALNDMYEAKEKEIKAK